RGAQTRDPFNPPAAVAPPKDDSEKWFVSLVTMQGGAPCERLTADWARSADLRAFAKPDDPAASWAHFQVYDRDDASQDFRFTKIKLTSFPTILIQPPRTGLYGSPATVVYQTSGYDGNAQKLAAGMSTAIRRYIATLPKREGVAQRDTKPPWKPTPKPAPPAPGPPDIPGPNVDVPPMVVPPPDVAGPRILVPALILLAGIAAIVFISKR
ncbi:MAG: hypothetical protein AAB368_16185, partial [bacterium]